MAPSSAEVAALMADLYFDENMAKSVLLQIGMRPNLIPSFTDANGFWSQMVFQLTQGLGIADGIPALLGVTAKRLCRRWERLFAPSSMRSS